MKRIFLLALLVGTILSMVTVLATAQTNGFFLNTSGFKPPKNILEQYRPTFCGFVPLTPESTVYVQCRLLPVSATNENCPDLTCSQALWLAKLDAAGTIEKDWMIDENYLLSHLKVKGLEVLSITKEGQILVQDLTGSSQEIWAVNMSNSKINLESFWHSPFNQLSYPLLSSYISLEIDRIIRINIEGKNPNDTILEITDIGRLLTSSRIPTTRYANLKAHETEFKPLTAKLWKLSDQHLIISGSAFLPSVKERGLKMWMGDEKATNPQYIVCFKDHGPQGLGTLESQAALLPQESLFFPMTGGEMGIIRHFHDHKEDETQFIFQKLDVGCKLSLPQIIDYPKNSQSDDFSDAELLQAHYLPDNSFILLYRAVSNEKITDDPILKSGQQFLMVAKFALSESTSKLAWMQEIPLHGILDPGVDKFIDVDPSLTADFNWVSDKQGLVFVHNRNISKNISYYPEKSFVYLNFLKIFPSILQIYSIKLEDDVCTEC